MSISSWWREAEAGMASFILYTVESVVLGPELSSSRCGQLRCQLAKGFGAADHNVFGKASGMKCVQNRLCTTANGNFKRLINGQGQHGGHHWGGADSLSENGNFFLNTEFSTEHWCCLATPCELQLWYHNSWRLKEVYVRYTS